MSARDALTGETALDYARRQVSVYKNEPFDMAGISVRLLGEDDGEQLAVRVFAAFIVAGQIDPAHAAAEASAGDPLFHMALCNLAADELSGAIQLREPLRSTVIATLRTRPKFRRAPRLETNYLRDIGLTMIVQEVRDRFHMPATGQSARKPNACAIVATAMGMQAGTVRKAVSKFINYI